MPGRCSGVGGSDVGDANGVGVGVGGNQTMVGVGDWVAGARVGVGEGAGIAVGMQAVARRQKTAQPSDPSLINLAREAAVSLRICIITAR